MEKNNPLVQDYLSIIESMKKEVYLLRNQLGECDSNESEQSDSQNYTKLRETLENDYQEIENLYSDYTETSSILMELKAEED